MFDVHLLAKNPDGLSHQSINHHYDTAHQAMQVLFSVIGGPQKELFGRETVQFVAIAVSPRYAGLFLGAHGFVDYSKHPWPCSRIRPSQRVVETGDSVAGKWH